MNVEALRAGLYALRAQADSMIALVEESLGQAGVACTHPETEDAGGTLGHPRRRCTNPACKQIVEG